MATTSVYIQVEELSRASVDIIAAVNDTGPATITDPQSSIRFPTTFTILFITALILHRVLRFVAIPTKSTTSGHRDGRLYPPGPKGLPLIGSLLDFRVDVFEKMREYAGKYGDIFYFRVGSTRIVVLANTDHIEEAFNKRSADMSCRPDVMRDLMPETRGIILSNPGPVHRRNKNFLSTGFRLIQLGMPEFSRHLHPHIDSFKAILADGRGRPVSMDSSLSEFLFAVFADLILGQDLNPKSEQVGKLLQVLGQTLTPNPMMVLAGKVIPEWAKALLADWVDMSDHMTRVTRFLKDHVSMRRALFTDADATDGGGCPEPNNLVDTFLYREAASAREKTRASSTTTTTSDPNHADSTSFPVHRRLAYILGEDGEQEKELAAILMDVFQAGCTSMVSLLQWILLNVTTHQDLQQRIIDEVDRVMSENDVERPSLLIRSSKFPLTRATVLETLRLFPPAPLGTPHVAIRDTTVGGLDIDQGTLVLPNFILAQRDPTKWDSPDEFRPDRFLSEDGRLLTTETHAFSAGPRTCPGKLLSITVATCFIVDVLWDYKFRFPAGQSGDLKGKPGIVYNPKPFSLICEHRQRDETRTN